MRSNDRSIVQSVEVHPGAALQRPNVADCVAGENDDGFIFDSNSAQIAGDAESVSTSEERNDNVETAQQPNVDANCLPCDKPAVNAQSSETEAEHFVPHIVDIDEFVEVGETDKNNHAPSDEILANGGCTRTTELRRRTAANLNS